MRPIAVLNILLSALAGSTVSALPAADQTAARPNIILIEADDQRPDAVGAFGDKSLQTPALDELVRSGVTLTNVRNQGSYNPAVCVASRAMLMSGRSLWHYDDNMRNEVTLGELLQQSGYHTFGTGKWHNGNDSLVRSFSEAENITPGFLPEGHDSKFRLTSIQAGKVIDGANTDRLHSSDIVGETAVKFIAGYKERKPFFLYLGFNAPHDPYTRLPAYEKFYRDAAGTSTVNPPPAFAPNPPFDMGVMKIRDERLLPRPLDPKALAEQNAIYRAMITHLDTQVGKVMAALKARGLDQNTILIFTSDHGLARGENGLLGKQNVYEHTLKIPFIVAGPGIPAGRQDASPIYNHELYKTIADFAGATPPERAEGESFRKVLENRGVGSRTTTYHGYTSLMRAVSDGGWKLTEFHVGKTRHTQLFDLTADPHEEKNLADDSAMKDRVAGLRLLMVKQRDLYEDRDTKFWNEIGFGTPVAPGSTKEPHTEREE